jgi:ABC-2 type transport system ATP-binding protein
MIRVQGLCRSFAGAPALKDVSFTVGRGEVAGLLGPNGAGKSTCLRVLANLLAPDAGQVTVDGLDIPDQGLRARRRLGYVAEGAPLPIDLRVVEYLAFRCALRLTGRERRQQEVRRVISLCDLASVERKPCGQLSRGYRQRVALADALLGDPPLLILDEPTVGLDPNQMAQVRKLIRDLAATGDHTVLLSSHLLGEVEAVCQRLIILNHGQVAATGTPEKLLGAKGGGAALLVRVKGPEEEVARVLSGIEGVDKVTAEEDGQGTYRLQCSDGGGDAVRQAVATEVVRAGFALVQLTEAPGGLEALFARLTEPRR